MSRTRSMPGDATIRAIREMTFEQKMDLLIHMKMERDPAAALRLLAQARESASRWVEAAKPPRQSGQESGKANR